MQFLPSSTALPASAPPTGPAPASRAATCRPHPLLHDPLVAAFGARAGSDDPVLVDAWVRDTIARAVPPADPMPVIAEHVARFVEACEACDPPGRLAGFVGAQLACGPTTTALAATSLAASLCRRARGPRTLASAHGEARLAVPDAPADDLLAWAQLTVALATSPSLSSLPDLTETPVSALELAEPTTAIRGGQLAYDAFHVAWFASRRLAARTGISPHRALAA